MPPYQFQDLVAALLRAMGYHVAWVAPPGKDGGTDIVAYTDPLGATEAGHIGLASMRERARLMRGTLHIDSGSTGTEVVARAPHSLRTRFGLGQRAGRT